MLCKYRENACADYCTEFNLRWCSGIKVWNVTRVLEKTWYIAIAKSLEEEIELDAFYWKLIRNNYTKYVRSVDLTSKYGHAWKNAIFWCSSTAKYVYYFGKGWKPGITNIVVGFLVSFLKFDNFKITLNFNLLCQFSVFL